MISQSYSQIRATIIKDIYNTLVEKGYQPDEVNLLEIDKEFSTTYIDYELKLCKCRIIKVHSTPYELTFTVDYEYNEDKRDINSIHFSVDDLFSILEEIDDLPTYNEAYNVEEIKKPNLADELNLYKRKLYDVLAGLVMKYGDRGVLDVFEFCSTTGNELQKSTIDQIIYFPNADTLYIVFNANTNDYCNIEQFYVEDLLPFVNGLQEWLEKKGNSEE